MASSFFWYDFETTGISPSTDRAIQVAGVRTDLELNEIEPAVNWYCQLSDDILPHPKACLVTGITPSLLKEKGLFEHDFFNRLYLKLSRPQTCTTGYNNIRFDDELARYSFYRNFFDPYAREWQSGNSRWDLIDVIRTAYALRPEGIEWPVVDGAVSLRLELLTAANQLSHQQAHDALSDVRATIALAKLIREKQPKLYRYLFNLRSKVEVQRQVHLLKPCVHISGRFSAQRSFLSVVLPLAWHPTNRNAVVVCDLQKDISPLLTLTVDELKQYLYTKHDALPEGVLPIPLKLIHINRCPVVAPLNVLRAEDIDRLALDLDACFERVDQLVQSQAVWHDKLRDLYADSSSLEHRSEDPEQQLYAGFISARDRRLCDEVRQLSPELLADHRFYFESERLDALLFRYRARNYPSTLTDVENKAWQVFCRYRLQDKEAGAPITYDEFMRELQSLWSVSTEIEQEVLKAWLQYGQQLKQKYKIDAL